MCSCELHIGNKPLPLFPCTAWAPSETPSTLWKLLQHPGYSEGFRASICQEPKAISVLFPSFTLLLLGPIQPPAATSPCPFPVPSVPSTVTTSLVAFLLEIFPCTPQFPIFNPFPRPRGVSQAGCDHRGCSWNPFGMAAAHGEPHMPPRSPDPAAPSPCPDAEGGSGLSSAPRTNITGWGGDTPQPRQSAAIKPLLGKAAEAFPCVPMLWK